MIPLIATALFGMAAHNNQKQLERDNARQDKLDTRADWDYQQRVAAAGRDDKLRNDMTDAYKPVTMTEGAGGMVKPDTMDNRDVGLPENADQPNGGLMQGGFKVGDKAYADKTQATQVMNTANTPEAQNERAVQALRTNVRPGEALQMQNAVADSKLKAIGLTQAEHDQLLRIQNEGALDAARRFNTGDMEGGIAAFQAKGTRRLPEGSKARQVEVADMFNPGKKVMGTQIYLPGADGQPDQIIVPDVNKSIVETLPFAQQYNIGHQQGAAARDKEDKDRNAGFRDREVTAHELLAKNKSELMSMQAQLAQAKRGALAGSGGEEQPDFLAGFDDKGNQSAVTKLVDEEIANSPADKKPNAQQRAAMIRDRLFATRDAYSAKNRNDYMLGKASAALSQAKANPDLYSQTYAKAVATGIAPEILKASGFESPVTAQRQRSTTVMNWAPGEREKMVADPSQRGTAVRGGDGFTRFVPYAPSAATMQAVAGGGNVSASPKIGDTRTAIGRGRGGVTQVYTRTNRGGSNLEWVDQ